MTTPGEIEQSQSTPNPRPVGGNDALKDQPTPHRLVAVVASWGEVELSVLCPYEGKGPRPCQLWEEARECKDDDCDIGRYLEFGHAHPVDGCYVQHLIGEIGWGEAVRWIDKGASVTIPADVAVWCDEEGIEMAPWPVHPGRRPSIPDGDAE